MASTPATPKPLLLLTAIVSAVAALLPEVVPDALKDDLKTMLGTHYVPVWTIAFLVVSATLFYLTWRERQGGGGSITRNTLTLDGEDCKVEQGTGDKTSISKADIKGKGHQVKMG